MTVRTLLALGCVVLATPRASCGQERNPPNPLCADFWRADNVFVGTVANIVDLDADHLAVTFKVVEALSRTIDASVTVSSRRPDAPCGWAFEQDRTYIVYIEPKSGDRPSVTLCWRTRPIEQAREDVSYGRYMQGVAMSRGQVHGHVVQDARPGDPSGFRMWPVPHAAVVLRGPETVRVPVDAMGRFETDVLPGDYTVDVASLPSGYAVQPEPETLWLPDARACARVRVNLVPSTHGVH
jgi:hypothetical protein